MFKKSLLLSSTLILFIGCSDVSELETPSTSSSSDISSTSSETLSFQISSISISSSFSSAFTSQNSSVSLKDTSTLSSASFSSFSNTLSSSSLSSDESNLSSSSSSSVSSTSITQAKTRFILSGDIAKESETRLDVSGAIKYEIKNLPSWVSLDEKSGVLNMRPDGSTIGHELFDVIVTKESEVITLKDALRISLFKPLSTLAQSIQETKPTTVKHTGAKAKTTTGGAVNLITNADGVNHTVMVQYFERYNTNTRLVAIDLATNTVKSILDENTSQGEGYNAGSHVPIGNGKEMFAFNKKGLEQVSIYDTNTHTWIRDIVEAPVTHGINIETITISTAGQVFTLGVNGKTGHPTLLRIDPNTYETQFYGDIGDGGWFGQQVVADDTYVYVNSGREPYEIIQVRISDGEQTSITKGYDLWMQQHKGGVTIGYGGKNYMMYQGKATELTKGMSIVSDAPWPKVEGECNFGTCYNQNYDRQQDFFYDVDSSAAIPSADNTAGYVWYQDSYKGAYKRITIPIVPLYEIPIFDLHVLPEVNKVLFAGDRYTGYLLQDMDTYSATAYKPISGMPSYYATDYSYPYVTMTGYPNGQTLVYDVREKWDNTKQGADYSPENSVEVTNPRNLGHMNKTSGNHKNYAVVTGNDGLLYFAGRWMRDGVGSGVEWYNLSDDSEGGLRKGFEDVWITQMKAVGDYIALGCAKRSGSSAFEIRMFNTTTKRVEYTIIPDKEISRVGYWSNYGDENILIYTRAGDTGIAGLLNVNVITKEVIYNKNLGIGTNVGKLSNEKEPASIFMHEGFAYLNAGGAVIRIEPSTGDCEVALRLSERIGRIQPYKNRLFSSVYESLELPFDFKWGFESADKREVIKATKVSEGNGNLVFTTTSTNPLHVEVTLDHSDGTIINGFSYDTEAINKESGVKMSLCMTVEAISGDVAISAVEYNGNETALVKEGESKYVEFKVTSYSAKDFFRVHFNTDLMNKSHFKLKNIELKKEISY